MAKRSNALNKTSIDERVRAIEIVFAQRDAETDEILRHLLTRIANLIADGSPEVWDAYRAGHGERGNLRLYPDEPDSGN